MKRLSLFLGLGIALASCTKEEGNNSTSAPLPTTYSFENVSYSSQTERLDMLAEITSYMKGVNSGQTVDRQQMLDMLANDNYTWTKAELNASTKQLADKIADGESVFFGAMIDELVSVSGLTNTGINGVAGLVSSGSSTYAFNENGIEPVQLIEKGLMGAVFIHQITQVYLGSGKMNVDNETVVEGKGTAMQHHWDEAYGYWNAPINLTAADFTYQKGADYDRFWVKYANGRDAILGSNAKLMKAYIKGRVAINNKDYATRDQAIAELREHWAEVQAATAIHYFNSAMANLGDDAKRNHALSEAIAFLYGLQFNPGSAATSADIEAWIDDMDNLYTITSAEIMALRDEVAVKFNLEAEKQNL